MILIATLNVFIILKSLALPRVSQREFHEDHDGNELLLTSSCRTKERDKHRAVDYTTFSLTTNVSIVCDVALEQSMPACVSKPPVVFLCVFHLGSKGPQGGRVGHGPSRPATTLRLINSFNAAHV